MRMKRDTHVCELSLVRYGFALTEPTDDVHPSHNLASSAPPRIMVAL